MRLKWDNVGRGLSDIASAVQTREIRDAQKEAIAKAKAEAEASGGLVGVADAQGADYKVGGNYTRDRDFAKSMAQNDEWVSQQQAAQEQAAYRDPRILSAPPGSLTRATSAETMPLGEAGLRAARGTPLGGTADAAPPTQPLSLEESESQWLNSGVTPADVDRVGMPVRDVGAVGAGLPEAAPSRVPMDRVLGTPSDASAQAADPAMARVERASVTERPKYDWQDLYHKKYVPAVIEKLIGQGKISEAQAFENWSTSSLGKRYGADWMGMYHKLQTGDAHGAIAAGQKLYNRMVPDGQYAVTVPLKDGKYEVRVYDEKTNKLVRQPFQAKTQDMAELMIGMMTPESVGKYVTGRSAEASKRAWEREKLDLEHANSVALEAIKSGGKPPEKLQVEDASGQTYWHFWDPKKQSYVKSDYKAPKNDVAELAAAVNMANTKQVMTARAVEQSDEAFGRALRTNPKSTRFNVMTKQTEHQDENGNWWVIGSNDKATRVPGPRAASGAGLGGLK